MRPAAVVEPDATTPSLPTDRAACCALDAASPLAAARAQFALPPDRLYFDGNSLGPPTVAVQQRVAQTVDEWRHDLVASWTRHDWIDLPRAVGARLAPLLGAEASEVTVCDSTSVNGYKALAAALALRPERDTIAVDDTIFPTDLYIAQGLADLLNARAGERGVRIERFSARRLAADSAARDLDDGDAELDRLLERSAVVLLQHVDFRTGRLHDLARASARVARRGALSLWDLSHSAGALPIDLDRAGVDFAIGCGYKYLAGGPGAPAFLYVAARHHDLAQTPIPGWLGHERPFAFDDAYAPAEGAARFVCGTPPILSLAAFDAALEIWDTVDLDTVRAQSMLLGDLFHARAEQRLAHLGFERVSPHRAAERGSQVALRHAEAWPMIRALHERGVVGDFRVPDLLRFGLAPLYLRTVDVWDAVEALAEVVESGAYRAPRFAEPSFVT